jgi:hypothetical protein
VYKNEIQKMLPKEDHKAAAVVDVPSAIKKMPQEGNMIVNIFLSLKNIISLLQFYSLHMLERIKSILFLSKAEIFISNLLLQLAKKLFP